MKKALFLMCLPFIGFSQIKVNGTVNNEENAPLPYANIVIYDSTGEELLGYTSCNQQGEYELYISQKQNKMGYKIIKVSFIGYETVEEKREISNNQTISFKLKKTPKLIDDVIVTENALNLYVQDDTTHYNLQKITNGTEETLKDIIEKLPGIDVDKNGKINSNGKKIDQLLIDGKSFFDDQHQLALNNITSEMIDGVSKYENYQDLHEVSDFSQSNKTAIDIKIKDEHKNKIKGNSNASLGYKNKYEAGINLYSFKKKANIYLIGKSNNLGNQSFTIEDYISFQGGIENLLEENNNELSSTEINLNAFSFLSNNKVEKKEENFGGLNLSTNPNNNLKINFYTLFNRFKSLENQFSNQRFFDNRTNSVSYNKTAETLFNNSVLKTSFKASEKSVLKYALLFSADNTGINNDDLLNMQKIEEVRNLSKITFNQNISYDHKISKSLIFNSSIYHSFDKNKNSLFIQSNDSFLGLEPFSNYKINQKINSSHNKLSWNNRLRKKLNDKIVLELNHNFSSSVSKLNTKIESYDLTNNILVNDLKNRISLNVSKNKNDFFNYKLGINFNAISRNNLHVEKYVLPYASIKLRFNKSHSLSTSYKINNQYSNTNHLINHHFIENYNFINEPGNLELKHAEKHHQWRLNYHLNDAFSGTNVTFYSFITIKDNIFINNSSYNLNYNSNSYQLSNHKNKRVSNGITIDKNFSGIPFSLSITSSLSYQTLYSSLQNIYQQTNSNIMSADLMMSSNFKKSPFNFEIGYKLSESHIKNISNNIASTTIGRQPFFNIFLKFKNYKLNFDNSLNQYFSQNQSISRYKLNPTLRYHKNKSQWTFSLVGNDILNTSNNYIIENISNNSYIEDKVVVVLPGYIVGEIKYQF